MKYPDKDPVDWTVFDKPLPPSTPKSKEQIEIEREFSKRMAEVEAEMKKRSKKWDVPERELLN